VPPTKVKKRHIKQGYLDKNAAFIKPDRLLSVTPILSYRSCKVMQNNLEYIDVHAHLQAEEFNENRNEIVKNASNKGVVSIFCASSEESHWQSVLCSSKHEHKVIPFIGIHPWFAHKVQNGWQERLFNAASENYCGIGEIGLDRQLTNADFSKQIIVFKKQLSIAKELQRPVTIHCLKAYGHLLEILKMMLPVPEGSFIHSYSGSPEMIKSFADLGLMFSYNGKALDNKNRNYIRNIISTPIENMLLETDSPYMLPQTLSQSETINTPANLPVYAKKIAEIKHVDQHTLAKKTTENARSIISLIIKDILSKQL
jgi:TatD DNase family protein